MKSAALLELEKRIGYSFAKPELLTQALTHSSHARQPSGAGGECSNERMEFLGDSILGFLVSEVLVGQFPAHSAGQLSKLKAHLVSAAHLDLAAREMQLGRYLLLGKGEEESGGRTKRTLRVDALESLVAALYWDGGVEAARDFIRRSILGKIDWEQIQTGDYKSELQEWLQARQASPPRYVVVQERGPEHSKVFTVQVCVGADRLAEAEGETKKAAQQAAARMALSKLREDPFGSENRETG
ncbi:MAG: ribonuclease III [Acidobacteria bacterium]|nr:ribonuclease III [Acidobacteriota bacterium]